MLDGSLRFNLVRALPAFVLVMLLLTTTGLLAPAFLTEANLSNLSTRTLPLGMVALGEAIVLLAGRIDLAVGSIMSLATAVTSSPTGQMLRAGIDVWDGAEPPEPPEEPAPEAHSGWTHAEFGTSLASPDDAVTGMAARPPRRRP